MNKNTFCVFNKDIKKVGQTKTELNAAEANLRSKLGKTLVDVRSGKAGAEELEAVRNEFETGDFSLEKVRDIINSYSDVIEKIIFADCLMKEGVSYIGFGASIESEQMKNQSGDIYVLFFGRKLNQSDQESWSGNRHHFLSLLRSIKTDSNVGSSLTNQTPKTTFIAVDTDIRPEVAEK